MPRRIRKLSQEVMEGIDEQARTYADIKFHERDLEDRRSQVGGELLSMMRKARLDSHRLDFNRELNATVRRKKRANMTIDEGRLRHAIGARAFNKLLTPSLDEAKVEAAIRLGELDPNVVASCTETSETDYLEVRFTQKRGRRDQDD